jgi:hypothetical protein
LQEMLLKFNDKSFMMNYSDDNHLFNSFKKMCENILKQQNQKDNGSGKKLGDGTPIWRQ